jgi:hypothetical protein
LRAQVADVPQRVVFFVTPHGHVPSGWTMAIPGVPADVFAERSLAEAKETDFGAAIRPLFPFRKRLLMIEGITRTSVLYDRVQVLAQGRGDDNNHGLAVAGLLTCDRALQRAGVPCTGGARSIDQVLAGRFAHPSRFDSRVYGADYVPNQTVNPFSFLAPGQPSPVVKDAQTALTDLLGLLPQGAVNAQPSRIDRIAALRGSVLNAVTEEFSETIGRVSGADRLKLESHRALIRDLEAKVGTTVSPVCDTQLEIRDGGVADFMRVIRLAFACDLTRVVTYVAPVPEPTTFGYPAKDNVHLTYAHASVPGKASCGTTYSPRAEQAMTDLGAWYARHFATLLSELDAVPEADGTLLDHTLVVWVTELATPTHQHEDAFTLVAGNVNNAFRTGRYVRFPRTNANPFKDGPAIGPGQNRFYVTLLRALGYDDTSFGMSEAMGADGRRIPLTGALDELLRMV